jgi:hypothetical protein
VVDGGRRPLAAFRTAIKRPVSSGWTAGDRASARGAARTGDVARVHRERARPRGLDLEAVFRAD